MVENSVQPDCASNQIFGFQTDEIIKLAVSNKLKDNWETFKPYWKNIQRVIPCGYRLCPVCGEVKQRRFRSHLALHGLSPKQWYDELMGYDKTPICPCCQKVKLKFIDKQLTYQQFCSKACNNRFNSSSNFQKRIDAYGSNFHPELWTLTQIINRGYTGYDDEEYVQVLRKSRVYTLQLKREHKLKYGDDAKPYAWTVDQLIARGYSGENDPKFLALIESNVKYMRPFKVRMNRKYGKDNKPLSWTDEQIKNRGYTGKNDSRYIRIVIAFLEKSLMNISRGGKKNIRKNGSNYTPSIWTDEQIKNRGFSGRNDPKYIDLCNQHIKHCSKAGKANVQKYGFFGAPGSWTDEQIKNRGYTGKNDPGYLKEVKKKREQSRKNGKKTIKSFGCSLHGWGFKINFIYDKKLFILDSLSELILILTIISNAQADEKIIDTQHYYDNCTDNFNGIGAIADIRTLNTETGKFTNWEVHDIHDKERLARKKFYTEINGDIFKLISLNDVQKMKRHLLFNGVITNDVISQIRYSNKTLRTPYVYDYEKEQSDLGNTVHTVADGNS